MKYCFHTSPNWARDHNRRWAEIFDLGNYYSAITMEEGRDSNVMYVDFAEPSPKVHAHVAEERKDGNMGYRVDVWQGEREWNILTIYGGKWHGTLKEAVNYLREEFQKYRNK